MARRKAKRVQALPPLVIDGMHGLGDSIPQRAIVRLMMQDRPMTWLHTPWSSIYHDMIGERLLLRPVERTLRMQIKNFHREHSLYSSVAPVGACERVNVTYTLPHARQHGSIVRVMATSCELDADDDDLHFRFEILVQWARRIEPLLNQRRPNRPSMVLRSSTVRVERMLSRLRNPDPIAFAELYAEVRDCFFVVSFSAR
jgi:hypothetical protein